MEWIRPWITPLSLLVVGVLLGFFVNSILLRSISKLSARTTWAWDNILASALSGFPLFWGFLAGLYGVIQFAPVSRQQLDIGTKVLIVLLILSITILIARVATGIAVDYSSRKEGRFPSATILSNLTRAFVYVLGFLTIFYTFGINITPALTALGIGGLAVALALQDTLSNFLPACKSLHRSKFQAAITLSSLPAKKATSLILHGGTQRYGGCQITWWSFQIRNSLQKFLRIIICLKKKWPF